MLKVNLILQYWYWIIECIYKKGIVLALMIIYNFYICNTKHLQMMTRHWRGIYFNIERLKFKYLFFCVWSIDYIMFSILHKRTYSSMRSHMWLHDEGGSHVRGWDDLTNLPKREHVASSKNVRDTNECSKTLHL
jgi:hypothetical protein